MDGAVHIFQSDCFRLSANGHRHPVAVPRTQIEIFVERSKGEVGQWQHMGQWQQW